MSAEPSPLDVAIEWTRRLAAAHRGAEGWPPAQLCDEIDRLRAEVERMRGIEQRAREVAEANTSSPTKNPIAIRAARYILGEEPSGE